ncbi:hypothetical protein VOLCADRAFT_119180 [Volvox carteri f. nagariensis]|uniref:PGG domain-containing protein n=1 Tax=Volvox carteri f. nagariensis TaxID=3068 RepID=D8UAU9_VOLCA|nr:uncharacterized protein VOLCADRAFT_119180 [Volvox carteri f. nagariensis]EFJ43163.1 hypothetical protein VOLCADRAFT_119180 [Volvox carteri f. nagariensis]|eukprot:XP_002955738.1 hypothetical protein VOLCADRAFT_119180 [Volvox carteri f. nagariensis]
MIAEKTGVQNTKERLKSFWTTLGVVSALMAALTYPAVSAPSVNKHTSGHGPGTVDDPLFMSYVLLNTSSLILSFMVVIISVVLLAEVDLVVTDDDLETFISRYQYLFLGLTGIFGFSILTIIASIIVIGFFNYNNATAIASAVICITGTVIVAIVSTWLALWTRARLKVHIAEANELLKTAVSRLRKAIAPSPPSAAATAAAATATTAPAATGTAVAAIIAGAGGTARPVGSTMVAVVDEDNPSHPRGKPSL